LTNGRIAGGNFKNKMAGKSQATLTSFIIVGKQSDSTDVSKGKEYEALEGDSFQLVENSKSGEEDHEELEDDEAHGDTSTDTYDDLNLNVDDDITMGTNDITNIRLSTTATTSLTLTDDESNSPSSQRIKVLTKSWKKNYCRKGNKTNFVNCSVCVEFPEICKSYFKGRTPAICTEAGTRFPICCCLETPQIVPTQSMP
jgi:hypothetical protein